jgi:hypothetical protein
MATTKTALTAPHCKLCGRRIRKGQASIAGNHATLAECEAGRKIKTAGVKPTAAVLPPAPVVPPTKKVKAVKSFKSVSFAEMIFRLNRIGKQIVVPNSLLRFKNRVTEPTDAPVINMVYDGWTGSTSWYEEFLRKNSENNYRFLLGENSMRMLCHYNLQQKVAGQYQAYLEPLAGAGFSAKIFEQDPAKVFVNDLDPLCHEILKQNFPAENVFAENVGCPHCRQILYGGPAKVAELVFLDFNDCTIGKVCKQYNAIIDDTFKMPNARFLIINDCTPFLLNHGKNGYGPVSRVLGVTVQTRDEYYRATVGFFATRWPEWQLTDVEHFSASGYLLFRRQLADGQPLRINFNTREDLDKNPMLVIS